MNPKNLALKGEKVVTDSNLVLSRLESERKRLSEELERLRASVVSSQERREEEAIENYELEKQLILRAQIEGRLAEIQNALRKLEMGTYGLCENCGRSIDPARLEVIPHASLCLDCKANQAKNKQLGHPYVLASSRDFGDYIRGVYLRPLEPEEEA